MLRWPHVSGLAIGLVAGCFLLSLTGSGVRRQTASGRILSECDGRLRELVIHYEPSAKEIALPVYRQFLASLERGVIVNVVSRDATTYQDLVSSLGPVQCTLRPILVRHSITTWSRDRWVALGPIKAGGVTTLWSPRGEAAEEIWPARAGDERVGGDIAVASRKIVAKRSSLYFDGGDFLADSENAFVVPRVLQRNLQHTVANRKEFLTLLEAELKRRVILLEDRARPSRRDVHGVSWESNNAGRRSSFGKSTGLLRLAGSVALGASRRSRRVASNSAPV